jgi:site-specific recombinase XerD
MTEEHSRLFNDFLSEEKLSGRTIGGLRILRHKTKILIDYLEKNQLEFNEVSPREAQSFQGWLLERGRLDGGEYVKSSIKPNITAAVTFYNYLKRKHLITTNPFKDIRRVRIEKTLPRNLLKEKQMDKYLSELSDFFLIKNLKQRISRYKYHLVAELMYSTGLRVSETANLNVGDIDLQRGLVSVIDGKQGISRSAYLNEYTKELLRIYIEQMRENIFNEWNLRNNRNSLFGLKSSSLEKELNKLLKKTAERLLYPKVTSHSFRHCLGYHLLRAGCDIRYIQEILGHKSLHNTEIYTKVDKEDLKKVFDKNHPRTFVKTADMKDE